MRRWGTGGKQRYRSIRVFLFRIGFFNASGHAPPVLETTQSFRRWSRAFEHLDVIVAGASVTAVRPPEACYRSSGLVRPGQHLAEGLSAFPPEFITEVLSRLGLFEHLHEDWLAPFRFSSAKAADIADWLGDHRSFRSEDVLAIDDEDLNLRGIHQHMPVSTVGFNESDPPPACSFARAVLALT